MSAESFNPQPRPALGGAGLRKASDPHPISSGEPVPAADKKRSTPDLSPTNAGRTSDTLKPEKKTKMVTVEVQMPKSLRRELRAHAAELGISVEELILRRLLG